MEMAAAAVTFATTPEVGAAATVDPGEVAVAPVVETANPPTAEEEAPNCNPPAEIAHGTEWWEDDDNHLLLRPIRGDVPPRDWSIRTELGHQLGPDTDLGKERSRLEYFLLMFPPQELTLICQLTNERLAEKQKNATTQGELLKFIGILILSTRFEFENMASLWATTAPTKYEPAPAFGRTGMTRTRFDDVWSSIRFSPQPAVRPADMSFEQYRSLRVDRFVANFNEYRASTFRPSELIGVKESLSSWKNYYGPGQPENACEIPCAACGRSGIMMQLQLVQTAEEEEYASQQTTGADDLLHGTCVLKQLVLPWANSQRIVCAGSYFAGVATVQEMTKMGLRFIGVVKTATQQFPMAYLNRIELSGRGDRKGLIAKDENSQPAMMAFVWMDQDRRYFVASASSLDEGTPYNRFPWRQVEDRENALPPEVQFTVPQPKAAELYNSACGMMDRHNRCRQDDLCLEKKLGTMDWSMRVNMSLLGICIVDTWHAWNLCTGNTTETQKKFYSLLAEELIDNRYDSIDSGQRGRNRRDEDARMPESLRADGLPRCGVYAHLTPTKKKKRKKDGTVTTFTLQGRCKVCRDKTTFICSMCKDNNNSADDTWLCWTNKGKMCFSQHMQLFH